MRKSYKNYRAKQRGVALVVGLILLMVLTLLAITGMNTASTELIMAGNEQFRENAFQAAETGIEQRMPTVSTVSQACPPTVVPTTAVPGSGGTDNYTTSTRFRDEGTLIPGSSTNSFTGFYYEITSTGTSTRNAATQLTQGVFIVQNSAGGGNFTAIVPPCP
jgi:Tfp pilus assembly protein PilX